MQDKGIVIEYDGYTGKIKDSKNTIIFTDKDVKSRIKINDKVRFIKEEIIAFDEIYYVAYFIEKLME